MRLVAFANGLQSGIRICYSSLVLSYETFSALHYRALYLDLKYWDEVDSLGRYSTGRELLRCLQLGGAMGTVVSSRHISILTETATVERDKRAGTDNVNTPTRRSQRRVSNHNIIWHAFDAATVRAVARDDRSRSLHRPYERLV